AKSNSGSGGNELLSDVRAYYTATMLDSIWTKQIEEYRYLKTKKNKQIHVVAVGSAIKQELKDAGNQTRDYALRRSVNVVVSTPGDNATADGLSGISGRMISLTGAPCSMLLNRTIQAPLSLDNRKAVESELPVATPAPIKQEAQQVEQSKKNQPSATVQPKEIKQSPTQEVQKQPTLIAESKPVAVKEQKERSSRCRVVLYNQYNSEDDAYKLADRLRTFGVQAVTKTYYDASKRKLFRVISGCYENDDELYKELLNGKSVVQKNDLDATPGIILSPDQLSADDPNAVWSVVVKSYVREEKEQFVTRIMEYIQSKPKYEYSNELSQQLQKPEPWLASTSTIWYFSEETKQKALELARELTALTGISFSLRRGSGSSYGTSALRTLTIHLVLQ
ncbi:MAG: hypothetical protein JNL32_14630, partial [Candidatus Kapabacteria bacterium]|nr:hypothetical protein [Candidatus Kapabacteria bacterium]